MGGGPAETETDYASQALCFMANAVNGGWRIPIGNFLISNLNAQGKKNTDSDSSVKKSENSMEKGKKYGFGF